MYYGCTTDMLFENTTSLQCK